MPLYDGIGVIAEKNAIVIDLGAAFCKIGYAGEASPRAIIRSPDLSNTKHDMDEVHDVFAEFVHKIYFEYLMVNPKDRRVVIVEALLGETRLRDELCKVLFCRYEVLSILLAPSHLMPLLGLGVKDGLVLDVGYSEATLIPVYENVPILRAWQAQPLASKAIHETLANMLHNRGEVKVGSETDFRKVSDLEIKITDDIVEDIKVRFCFVTDIERGHFIQQIHNNASEVPGLSSFLNKTVASVMYPLDGNTLLRIDGETRESVCEVLFEQDNDCMSVATMVLDALLACPIDLRRHLAENLVIVGGTTMIRGFKARLFQELKHLLKTERYRERLFIEKFKLHVSISKEIFASWSGASLLGATDAIVPNSFSRELFLDEGAIPDWANLKFNSVYNEERIV